MTLDDDDGWNRRARGETKTQRLDRNWSHLLQELRVLQTGVQLLTGFLVTLPFQPGFADLDTGMRAIYLTTMGASVAATVFVVAPVAWHRVLFRRHRLEQLVAAAHRFAAAGMVCLAVALTGALVLVVDRILGEEAAAAAAVVLAVSFLLAWMIGPWRRRGHRQAPRRSPHSGGSGRRMSSVTEPPATSASTPSDSS